MNNRTVESIYPLSPMQQGMLFHSLFAPELGVYVEQTACTIEGDLDVEAFAGAWRQAIARHAILRTGFAWEKLDRMLQAVQREVELPLRIEDWRDLTDPRVREDRWRDYLARDLREGFRLTKAPLLRLFLARTSDHRYRFAFSHHHALLDGWSLPLLMREVFSFYDGLRRGESLSPLPVRPYRDYIAWLQAQDAGRAEGYWRRYLAGVTAPTRLGIGQAGRREESMAGECGVESRRVGRALSAAWTAFARHYGLTLNTLIEGAWALLLGRYSGQDDVLFGATVAGRPADLDGAESMIGLFINTLPVRVSIMPGVPVGQWLTELRDSQAEAREFEYSPLIEVQGWSDIPRHLPLFETIFVFENYPVDESLRSLPGGLRISDLRTNERTNYPLTVVAAPGDEILLRINYDAARFRREEITGMLRHWEALIAGMVESPWQAVDRLPMLDEMETRLLVEDHNRTTRPYPADETIPRLFARQVARDAEATAVVFDEEQLSYGELDRRANQLANYLVESGVGPESIVGLLIERSLDLPVGIMGILKAGGAYLPLDPSHPPERIRFMLEDAGVGMVVTQSHLVGLLPARSVRVLRLDTDYGELLSWREDAQPVVALGPHNAAYAIYTSGSTGRPKGTIVEHQAAINLWVGIREAIYQPVFGDDEQRRVRISLSAPLTFDASVAQWIMLLSGHTLFIVPEETRRDPEALLDFVRRRRLEAFETVPAQLRMLLAAGFLEEGAWRPQLTIFGGEAIDDTTWRQLRSVDRPRFFNVYGPTEATVIATAAEVGMSGETPNIGRPLANYRLRLLDSRLRPAPPGVAAELWIGGDGLARGYLNRPQLTAERFIPDPFVSGSEGGAALARIYRTGDLARYRPDGKLEFVGRVDDQVKIRGLRIELGEIESLLREHPQITGAAAGVRRQPNGDDLLAVWFTTSGEEPLSPIEIRDYLRGRLPEYMVPGIYCRLEALPLLANGKLDRQALPVVSLDGGSELTAYREPRTPAEEIMCGIWERVLGRERVGVDDEFFALGGHSLLATRIVSRIREAFGVDLPLRTIFDRSTVAGLTKEVVAAGRGGELVRPPIERADRSRPLPLSFAQQRLWFLDQLEPGSASWNNPMAVRLGGRLDTVALEGALNGIVSRHEVLRTRFPIDVGGSGEPVQMVAAELWLPLEVTDLGGLPESEREPEARRLARVDAGVPFDLAAGPLLRWRLLRLGDEDHVLLLTMHHIVSDGWSLDVIAEEVSRGYQMLTGGTGQPLPGLPIQYGDYALWQRSWLAGEVLDEQLRYWKGALGGATDPLELPTDRPRPPVQTERGGRVALDLPADLINSVEALSRRQGVTVFMAMLAAFQTLLHRYTHQSSIRVGTPIANRTSAEIEGLIGFFVNTLVMKADFEGDPRFSDLLQRVREESFGAYAHQDLPFEQLVEALQPERDRSHSPLFQVMFMLQGGRRRRLEMAGVTLGTFEIESGLARYDLTVEIVPSEQGMRAVFEYNADLFDRSTIERLAGHYRRLLLEVADDPARPVSVLPMADEEERDLTLCGWNSTAISYPADRCFHDLFEECVARDPGAAAISFDGRTLSYGELNERANRLGHYLCHEGVGKGPEENLVGLHFDRSIEAVIGVLGVLKAGGAYLPLDPHYPRERLDFMIRDSRVGIVLTTERLLAGLPIDEGGGVKRIAIDRDWRSIEAWPSGAVGSGATAESPAYAIYTSGSTGQPKGALLLHRGLCNLAQAQRGLFGLGGGKRVLQFSSFSFDASVWEMAMALASGACLVMARQDRLTSLSELHELLRREAISAVTLPPSVLRLLPATDLPSLEVVIAAGESCTREIVARWAPGRRFFNAYGPTEATVCATIAECEGPEDRDPPIGRPLPNTVVYVLDQHGEPTPIGVSGELCIGGVGLARGYLGRPELTAEKFLPNRFSDEPGSRIYRTGDLVRYRESGELEYLGRIDTQVKIRGYRIEPGEVEAALREHPSIADAVVIPNPNGAEVLLAYLLLAEGCVRPAMGELRERLRHRLPDYMVPAICEVVDHFPMTPNGKVDRRALPVPGRDGRAPERAYEPPRDDLESLLARLWAEMLGVVRVGVADNFFELGGHSLLASRMVTRLRDELAIELPLRVIFDSPTVAGLAAAIRAMTETRSGDVLNLEAMVAEIDRLSEEDARALLGG